MSEKNKLIGTVAGHAAGHAVEQAKQASGWKKVAWSIGAAIAAAIAWLCSGAGQQQPDMPAGEPAVCTPEGL